MFNWHDTELYKGAMRSVPYHFACSGTRIAAAIKEDGTGVVYMANDKYAPVVYSSENRRWKRFKYKPPMY